jgi:plasmid replication initiation protein
MREYNETGHIPKEIIFNFYDLLKVTGRGTCGRSYLRLKDALTRLRGTQITTTISSDEDTITSGEGLIENWKIHTKTKSGKVIASKVTLSDWTVAEMRKKKVKTLHRDYFLLRRPIDKRLYEIVKRHIGTRKKWEISTVKLHKRTGASSSIYEFRRLIEESLTSNHLPEFNMEKKPENPEIIIFTKRNETRKNDPAYPKLTTENYEAAKKAAPRYDVYRLERAVRMLGRIRKARIKKPCRRIPWIL